MMTRIHELPGQGPTVLLLHGATDSADAWLDVLDLLAVSGRAAIAVDLPSHGCSAPMVGPPRLSSLDAFMAAAIDHAEQGDGVIALGNSLGALLALRAAEQRSEGLLGVVALAPPGSVITPALRWLPVTGSSLAAVVRRAPIPERLLQEIASRIFFAMCVRRPVARHRRRQFAQHVNAVRLSEQLRLSGQMMPELINPDLSTLRTFALPVTFWWGSRDLVCPASGADRFGPERDQVMTPGAGHSPQWSDPDLVLDLLLDHEERVRRRRSAAS